MSLNRGLSAMERGIPQGILGGLVGGLFTMALQGRGDLPGNPLVTIAGVAFFSFVSWGVNHLLINGSARAVQAATLPSGDTTAYIPTFSHIEALEIRGDLEGAAKAWTASCAEHPGNALVRVKAADFHLRLRKDAAAALPIYREVRELPGASRELVRYAQAKIVDLYLGPLKDEGRALVELRRLIEGFPGTREAEEARAALARIKQSRNES